MDNKYKDIIMKNKKLYVDDDRLFYEIKLSQGKGFLTEQAKIMLVKIADNFMYNFYYFDESLRVDCYQSGVEIMLRNWYKFNTKKYYKALPYFTELMKRGAAYGLGEQQNKKKGVGLDIISINKFIF
jgi:hypothetical protein